MESKVLDPEVAAGLDTIAAGISRVFAAGLDLVDSTDAVVLVREVECQTRRMQAMQNDTLTAIDQRSRAGKAEEDEPPMPYGRFHWRPWPSAPTMIR